MTLRSEACIHGFIMPCAKCDDLDWIEKLKRNTLYPVVDRVPGLSDLDRRQLQIRAIWTGEFRCPKKGEWYLSGSPIEAYRAPNDLPTKYHIAKLVKTKTITETIIVGDYKIPDKYRILCWNCNCGRRHGECPHEKYK